MNTFVLLLVIGLMSMGLPIYQINHREVGTMRVDAHRIKRSSWRGIFRAQVAAWRAAMSRWVPLAAAVLLLIMLAHALPAHAAPLMAVVPIVGIKQLEQAKVDNDSDQASLRAEGRKILLVDAATRTPEQKARLAAIDADLDALADKAVTITSDIARAKRYQDDERREGRVEFDRLEMGANRAEKRKVTFGEFLQGVAFASMPGMADLIPEHVKAELYAGPSGASAGISADGGFLVRSEWSTALLDKAQESSQLLSKCFDIPIGEGADGIEAPYVNETSRATGSRWGGVQIYRRAEADTVTAQKPGLGKFELRLEDLMGIFYTTERLLRDATALQAIAEKAFASEFAFRIDDEFIRGTGAGQSLGILNADCKVKQSKQNAQTNGTIKAENVINMFARMRARNMGKAEWYINTECLPQLMTMSIAVGTAGGQLVYMPPGGLSSSPYGTLMGRPVNPLEQCSALGTEGDIIFADWSEYAVIQKALVAAESMHVRFLYNERTFRWVYPIIGKPTLASAITPYKGSNTVSPFVTLENR